jgi:ribosomal protein L37AE/L43A
MSNEYNGDRECLECQINSLIEDGLTKWKCLKCGRIFDEEYLEGEETEEY